MFRKRASTLGLIAVLLVTASIRLRLLDVPLERDEGEYAYAGQLFLDGVLPFEQAYNMKMPGIYIAYAAIMAVFGESVRGIHLGLLLVNAASTLLLFVLVRRLFNEQTAILASAYFAFLTLSETVLGVFAHATHFVVLFALGGLLALNRAAMTKRVGWFLVSGLLLGVAFTMKQHGAAFIVFAGLVLAWLAWNDKTAWRLWLFRLTAFSVGVFAPFALICIAMAARGVFSRFWFWTFTYASAYVSTKPLSGILRTLSAQLPIVIGGNIFVWVLAGIGVLSVLWYDPMRKHAQLLIFFLLCSCLATMPGFYFREHYFVLMLPAIAVLAAIGCSALVSLFPVSRPSFAVIAAAILSTVALGYAGYRESHYLFRLSPDVVSRRLYGGNPFVESEKIAKYIADHTQPNDRIAVIGSEPQIYFYANRRGATGYVYTYPLMEEQPYASHMQQEMISQIEATKPKYIVYVNIDTSWLAGKNSEKTIFEWLDGYRAKHYTTVGVIDFVAPDRVFDVWDKLASAYTPRSPRWIAILKR